MGDSVVQKICAISAISAIRGVEHALRLEPTSAGDKRDDISAYAPHISDCPVCTRRALSPGLGWPGLSGGGVFPKLSKLLNQEDALGAPCLRGEFCSPHVAPSRGAPILRTSIIRHFDVTLPFASPKSSSWQALMFPQWLAAMPRQSAPVQGQAEPSWQDGSDV